MILKNYGLNKVQIKCLIKASSESDHSLTRYCIIRDWDVQVNYYTSLILCNKPGISQQRSDWDKHGKNKAPLNTHNNQLHLAAQKRDFCI